MAIPDTPTPVSVLLATVSMNEWLDAAVHSVLAQEGVEFELIIIFDGISPCASRPWMRDSRVRVVSLTERSGLANALNAGLVHAQFAYIARLDADDLALPGRLRIQSGYLDLSPELVAIGSAAVEINEHGVATGKRGPDLSTDVTDDLLIRNRLIHPSMMIRRSAIDAAGGYNGKCRQMEDYELWLRLAKEGRLAVVGCPLVAYRVHGNQMSRGARPRGAHVDAVLTARRALARAKGVPMALQYARDLAWRTAQFKRYYWNILK